MSQTQKDLALKQLDFVKEKLEGLSLTAPEKQILPALKAIGEVEAMLKNSITTKN